MKCWIVIIASAILLITSSINETDKEQFNESEPIEEISTPSFHFHLNNRREYIDVDSTKNVLLIGDSRTVGLHNATGYDEFSYISKVSMGYDWLVDGTPKYNTSELVIRYLEANPEGKVIINLGVNDLYNKGNYAEWVRCLVESFPESNIYYLSINPSTRSSLDSQVDSFNTYMKEHLPESVVWIDSNNYLKQNGFSTVDGVHYTTDTYQEILDCILD